MAGYATSLFQTAKVYAKVMVENPCAFMAWRRAQKIEAALCKWDGVIEVANGEIATAERACERAAANARTEMRMGRKAAALPHLKERARQRTKILLHNRQINQAEAIRTSLQSSDIETGMIEAMKETVSVMKGSNFKKDIDKADTLMEKLQESMDLAGEFSTVIGESLETGGEALSDDALFAEMEDALAEELDHRAMGVHTSPKTEPSRVPIFARPHQDMGTQSVSMDAISNAYAIGSDPRGGPAGEEEMAGLMDGFTVAN